MADHPRLAILKALTTHLEGINGEEPWTFNLVGKVFRGRTLFGDSDPETMLSIMEAPQPDPGATFADEGALRREGWRLLLQGWTKADTVHPVDPLYPLLAEVEARLTQIIIKDRMGKPAYPAFYLLPDADGEYQITDLELQPPVVRPPGNEPPAKACFYLPLRVGLALSVG